MTSFASRVSSYAMQARLAEMRDGAPALQVTSMMLGPDRFLEWAHAVGYTQDRRLRGLLSPVAPEKLRAKTAAPEEEIFLWTGFIDLANFFAVYERVAGKRPERILDFGCGCGRLTRYLDMMEGISAHAVEVNPSLATWCQENLKRVRTLQNTPDPAMPIETASLDFVYALSIFTHFSLARTDAWRAEMARVLQPGGILLLTTHGTTALDIIATSSVHQGMFSLTSTEAQVLKQRLAAENYIYLPYDRATVHFANAGADYGNSFVDAEFLKHRWNDANFECVEHIPGGLRGWQDIVVLRRK